MSPAPPRAPAVRPRDRAARRTAVALLTVLALGTALMALAHTGVAVPLLDAIGPGGDTVVPQAAIGFAVAAAGFAAATAGLLRARRWGWALGVVVLTATLLAAAVPFRGAGSVLGMGLAAAGLVALALPGVRRSLAPPVG